MIRILIIMGVACVLIGIVIVLLNLKKKRLPTAGSDELHGILALHGTVRLEALMGILQRCIDSGVQDGLVEIWGSIEIPLRAVLLDATTRHKQELVRILDACHGLCRNREIAHSLMDVRNELS